MNENEIKDMAELIKLPIESWLEDTGAIPQATTYYAELISCINDSAEVLFNESYRKVGEDEVVITKREYEQLKKYNRDRKRLRLKWQQAKQDLDDIYSNGFVLLVEHHEIVDQVARETRQETAREIINMLTPPCKACDANWHKGCMCLQKKIIKQIAQKYGVELEE